MRRKAIMAALLLTMTFLTGCAKDSKDNVVTITNVSYDPTR